MNSKIYRCGWCGNPTDNEGNDLQEKEFKRVVNLIENYEVHHHTHLTNGACCPYGNEGIPNRMQVTRDMAIDAQDLSLEGQWI